MIEDEIKGDRIANFITFIALFVCLVVVSLVLMQEIKTLQFQIARLREDVKSLKENRRAEDPNAVRS